MIQKNFHPHRLPNDAIGATYQIEHEGQSYPVVVEWSLSEAAWYAHLIMAMVAQDTE